MINYSFIIPHHNCPHLLNRLLDTIPERNDIEIIVVDDNSDFDKRPVISRSDARVVLISESESEGAGHARNVGLELAEGRWLLFADSDDYYECGFINILDNFLESDNDIVFFCAHVLYDPLHPETSSGLNYIEKVYRRYESSNKSEFEFRRLTMTIGVPWNKMFRHDFISNNNVKFESVPVGNDQWFNKYAGSKAQKVSIISDRLYYYLKYDNNTTFRKRPFDDYYKIIDSSIRRRKLMQQYGLLRELPIWGFYPKSVFRDYGIFGFIKLCIYTIAHDSTFVSMLLSKIKGKFQKL